MPDIDPTDVLPVNNLPAPSAPWGRAMEKRLRALEKAVVFGDQDIQGQNRNTAATLDAISEQLNRIPVTKVIVEPEHTVNLGDATFNYVLVPIEVPENANRVSAIITASIRNGSRGFTGFFEVWDSVSNPYPAGMFSSHTDSLGNQSASATVGVNLTITEEGFGVWVALAAPGGGGTADLILNVLQTSWRETNPTAPNTFGIETFGEE